MKKRVFTKTNFYKLMRWSAGITAMVAFFTSLTCASTGQAQEILQKKVTITLKDVTLREAFSQLEAKTSAVFLYSSNIPWAKTVSVEARSQKLSTILQNMLSVLNLEYRIVDYQILIKEKDKPVGILAPVSPQSVHLSKIIISDKLITPVYRQPVETVTGKVTDLSTSAGLPGVNVTVKGSTQGTVTNENGNFTLSLASTDVTLVFSYIGYVTEEVPLAGRTTLNIGLAPDVKSLSEVVVVGYGTVNRRDLTGSVTSVKAQDIQAIPVSSSEQILQGRIPGLQVTQASSAPGGGVTIRIRGSNSVNAGNEPLYVIDGFPVYSDNTATPTGVGERTGANALAAINPNDIESIEVLKDASATAIYGSRGANGVILITTKRGKAGQNRVNVQSYYGVQQVRNTYDLLNSAQLTALANEYGQRQANPVTPYPSEPTTNTDWQKEVFRTAAVQNHSVSFTGGNETTNYLLSGDYYNEEGVVLGSKFRRISLRSNLDKVIGKRFKVGNSLTLSRTENDARDMLGITLRQLPMNPVYDQFGNYFLQRQVPPFGDNLSRLDNPVSVGNNIIDKTVTARALGNIYGEVNLLEGLTGKVLIGADISYAQGKGYAPRSTLGGSDLNGVGNLSFVENYSWLNENTLTYNRSLGEKHRFTALAGYSIQRQNLLRNQITRANFPTDATTYYLLNSGSIERNTVSGGFQFTIQSYFGRLNYTFNDKYLFTFTARTDGSSKFGEGRKYGFFPSGAFAWRAGDEPFIKDLNLFSDLKLRTSYGITGNQEIPPYRSMPVLRGNRGQIIGGEQVTGFSFSGDLLNPELGWEQTAQFDIGIDMSFINNRITLTADYYQKRTSDLLFQVDVPVETGFRTQWRNIGNVKNQGLELALSSQNTVGAFKWTTEANLSVNTNRVTNLPSGTSQILVNLFPGTTNGVDGLGIIKTGESIGSFYTYVSDGIWQTQEEINAAGPGFSNYKPGDIRYRDINSDGKIDGSDRTITGRGVPKYLFGLNNTFSYKNFELTLFLQGVADVDVVNLTRWNLENTLGQVNTTTRLLDRWTGPNTSNTIPRVGATNFFLTNRYVENGSFLRLRTATLAYNLPISLWNVKWLSGIRVYATGQNLLTFTNYSGFDPEVNVAGQAQALQGIDQWSYPFQRRYVFGLNVTF